MDGKIGWGILGPGAIANRFVSGLIKLPDADRVAVGSRSGERAAAFAHKYGFQRAYGSYDELVCDSAVDVIYVATPHPFHCEHTLLCLEHGKAVLCEKPMGVNESQVRQVVERARAKKLYLVEGMWTRALPVIRQVRAWLDEGQIGEARSLSADFGFRTRWDPSSRLLDPALAGGALLDVGGYVIALANMVFGRPPAAIHAAAAIGETGVDEQTAMLFRYDDGALALLSCAIRTNNPQSARIDGTMGRIEIPAFWHATSATLYAGDKEPMTFTGAAGYHFEAAETMACLRAGHTESELVPLDESLAVIRAMDRVRAKIGVVYPPQVERC